MLLRTPRDRRGPLHAGRRASVIYFSLLSPLLSSLVFCLGVVAFIHLCSFLMRSQVIPRMSTLLSCCHHEKPLGPFTLDVAPVVSSFCSLLSCFSFLFFSFLLLASYFSLALTPYNSLSRKEALDNLGSSGVPHTKSIPFHSSAFKYFDILNEYILNDFFFNILYDFFLLPRFPFLMFSFFVCTSLLLRWMNGIDLEWIWNGMEYGSDILNDFFFASSLPISNVLTFCLYFFCLDG